MGFFSVFCGLVSPLALGLVYYSLTPKYSQPRPELQPNPWWGREGTGEMDTSIRDFAIDISSRDIFELYHRLAKQTQRRLDPFYAVDGTPHGLDASTMRSVLSHWPYAYDWKKRQTLLMTFPHFKTNIDGLDIHWMRSSPPSDNRKHVYPLLLVHGWPSSFVEFLDILPLLTTPTDDSDFVFDVIVPSIPGFGFSEAAQIPGLDLLEVAGIFVKLMERNGFNKFYVHGGDCGATIASNIAAYFPDRLLGVHVNLLREPSDSEESFLLEYISPSPLVRGQSSSPNMILGLAYNSAPLGLAAYIFEEFDVHENQTKKEDNDTTSELYFPIALDKMLDNICIYWFTMSITSSMRLHEDSLSGRTAGWIQANGGTWVPAGVLGVSRGELPFPRHVDHKFTNVLSFTSVSGREAPTSRFLAMERPDVLADDLRQFVRLAEASRLERQRIDGYDK